MPAWRRDLTTSVRCTDTSSGTAVVSPVPESCCFYGLGNFGMILLQDLVDFALSLRAPSRACDGRSSHEPQLCSF